MLIEIKRGQNFRGVADAASSGDRATFGELFGVKAVVVRYYCAMNLGFNFILGVLAIVYGLYSYYQRKTAPERIEKLQSMIERNGEKMAHSIHLFGYTILPIVSGLLLLFAAYRGM